MHNAERVHRALCILRCAFCIDSLSKSIYCLVVKLQIFPALVRFAIVFDTIRQ